MQSNNMLNIVQLNMPLIRKAARLFVALISISSLTGIAGAVYNSILVDNSIDDRVKADGNNGNELYQIELLYRITSALTESESKVVEQKPASEITVFILDDFIGERWSWGKETYILVQQEIVHPSLYDLKYNIIKKDLAKLEGKNEVLDKEKYFNVLLEVLNYTVNNPDKRIIINIPWSPNNLSIGNVSNDEIFNAHALIKELTKKGAIVVVAAGDENIELKENRYPATFPESIVVGDFGEWSPVKNLPGCGISSVKQLYGKLPVFTSNYGPLVDIFVPGEYDIFINSRIASTNMVVTFVNMFKSKPVLTSGEAVRIIMDTAVPLNESNSNEFVSGAIWHVREKTMCNVDESFGTDAQISFALQQESNNLIKIVNKILDSLGI